MSPDRRRATSVPSAEGTGGRRLKGVGRRFLPEHGRDGPIAAAAVIRAEDDAEKVGVRVGIERRRVERRERVPEVGVVEGSNDALAAELVERLDLHDRRMHEAEAAQGHTRRVEQVVVGEILRLQPSPVLKEGRKVGGEVASGGLEE
jgi:hypothetical protein